MEEIKSGIYVIENNITHHKYVGLGEVVEKRMWEYHKGCKAILDAIESYGKENFSRYVIEYCEIDKLEEREIFWIKELHSHVSEGGYNITWGGNHPSFKGISHTDEWKKERSRSTTGTGNPFYGKHHSEKTIMDQIKRQTGKHINSDKSGSKNPMYGKNHSESAKKKMSDFRVGKFEGINSPTFGYKSPYALSIYRGVSRHISNGKDISWTVNAPKDGKTKYISNHKNEIDAARAYDKYIVEHNLPHPLNFPEEWENK